ncbi:MAG: LiaF domain-containing protein [Gemmatimonadota bacterium]
MAKKPAPRQEPALVTVEGEREKTIALLSEHFAQDNLSLDELEKRIEAAYRTVTVAGLRELTRDLMVESAAPSSSLPAVRAGVARAAMASYDALEHERIASIMSETKRTGPWSPARKMDVWCVMSETTLDLTQATLQPGVTEIRLHGLMASIKIIVPPGVRVVLQASAIMASVSDETIDPPAVGSGAPVVRITGRVMMTELVAVMRRRELSAGDE